MYTIRLLFLLAALQFFSVLSFSQSFKKYNDPILNKTIITYHNVDAQIIFQKTISGNPSDETSPVYEIGLIRYDKSFGADDFMNSKAIVVFEDQSLLILNDPVARSVPKQLENKNYRMLYEDCVPGCP